MNTFLRALLLIGGALALIGASPGSQARLLGADKPAVGATDAHPASAQGEGATIIAANNYKLQKSIMTTQNTPARPAKPLHRGRGWGGSSYFTISELTASATAQREGIDNRPTESAYHLLHVLVEQLLDPIREAWGEPIVVSSGYRCKELNALVGGAKNSHHMLGCAADITAPLCSQAKLLDADKSTAVATDAHTASAPQPKVDAQRGQSQGGEEKLRDV